uniref:Uncharacterized protein n=1 Tax=Setaria viridis TaxID=4556 RepID=A0A4V6D117_SETVI|nr:hypothetical protein SEVIR_9G164100v2 [Setaria viridis]
MAHGLPFTPKSSINPSLNGGPLVPCPPVARLLHLPSSRRRPSSGSNPRRRRPSSGSNPRQRAPPPPPPTPTWSSEPLLRHPSCSFVCRENISQSSECY